MTACRSGDPSMRLAAVQAARTMADLSEDEDSPHSEQNMSYIGFCNTMDEVEQALAVGQQLAAVASSSNQPAGSSSSVDVDRVADALLRSLADRNETMDENMEEESADSDECMKNLSEKMRRYQNAELCEVSDPEAWMELHHGASEPAESTEESDDDP